jgi:hypothetical protein
MPCRAISRCADNNLIAVRGVCVAPDWRDEQHRHPSSSLDILDIPSPPHHRNHVRRSRAITRIRRGRSRGHTTTQADRLDIGYPSHPRRSMYLRRCSRGETCTKGSFGESQVLLVEVGEEVGRRQYSYRALRVTLHPGSCAGSQLWTATSIFLYSRGPTLEITSTSLT